MKGRILGLIAATLFIYGVYRLNPTLSYIVGAFFIAVYAINDATPKRGLR